VASAFVRGGEMSEPGIGRWKKADAEDLDFQQADRWYKGEHCTRYPTDRALTVADVMQGWVPERPFITRSTRVLAFGSCFAEYFIRFLAERGYNRWQIPAETHGLSEEPLLLSLGNTFENVFVIVQQFRWAYGEFTPASHLWFTKDKRYFEATEERRENIRTNLERADVVVITLGMSEVWYDALDGEVLWRSIPARLYDPHRHAFKVATVAETTAALHELDRLIARFRPELKVVFTLSPIPFVATFRNQSPVTANTVSKAILRAALDGFLAAPGVADTGRYHYFPSYELTLSLFESPFLSDNRHVKPEVATLILSAFSGGYTDLPREEASALEASCLAGARAERSIHALEQQLLEKERVIRELDHAARERLKLIERLNAEIPP
jgi:hypothetical protein